MKPGNQFQKVKVVRVLHFKPQPHNSKIEKDKLI